MIPMYMAASRTPRFNRGSREMMHACFRSVLRRFDGSCDLGAALDCRRSEFAASASTAVAVTRQQHPHALGCQRSDAVTAREALRRLSSPLRPTAAVRISQVAGAALIGLALIKSAHAALPLAKIKTVYRVASANHDFTRIAIAATGLVWVLNADAAGKYHALYAFDPSGRLVGKYPETWTPMAAAITCEPRPGGSALALQSQGAAFMQCVRALEQTGSIRTPVGMVIDHSGNIWVISVGASHGTSTLFEISPHGAILGKPSSAGIHARDLTIAPNGDLWVVTDAAPKVDPDAPAPQSGSRSAINRLWGGNPELRVYNPSGVLLGKVKYFEFPVTESPTTILKRTGIWTVTHNLVFTSTGNFTNISVTLLTKHHEYQCRQCLAIGEPTTDARLLYDYNLAGEPYECAGPAASGAPGGDGGGGSRYAAFAPDGLLWRSWDQGLVAVDLKRGVVKRSICGKKLKLIQRFVISQDGDIWAYAPMLHGVVDIQPDGRIRRFFPRVKARDLAIDQHGDVWTVSGGRVVELVGAARKPQYFPYGVLTTQVAPQWP